MLLRFKWLAITSTVLLLSLAACAPLTPVPAAEPIAAPVAEATTVPAEEPAAERGLTDDTLANMEYQVEYTSSGTAPLENGEYREPAAPGSATETVVQLSDQIAYGTLDGQEAAAVVLISDPGGSGTFYDLAVVVNQDGAPANVATSFLGDRVQINSVVIEDNRIVVDMVTQGPDDAQCCPTQQVVQTYELVGFLLVQASSEVIGTVEPTQPATPTAAPEAEPTAAPTAEPTPEPVAEQAAAPTGALSPESLANATYMSEWTGTGTVTLEDGKFEMEAAPGSASKIQVELSEYLAYGDLTGDGVDDAAVILWSSGGGSGTFYDLAVMMDQDGVPTNVAKTLLGDRVQINSLAVEDGRIVVDYVRAGPSDPACCPSQHVVESYALHSGQLLMMSRTIVAEETQAAAEPSATEAAPAAAATEAVDKTEIIAYVPSEIPAESRPGSCWANAIGLGRADAWRCTVENQIFDPCFQTADGETVVCDANPVTGETGFVLELTEPLPAPDTGQMSNPWLVDLADGTYCGLSTGTVPVVEGRTVGYSCTDQTFLFDAFQEGDVWIAEKATISLTDGVFEAHDPQMVPIITVWR